MLAPREFLSPEQLGVAPRIHAALHELKKLFEDGVMLHVNLKNIHKKLPPLDSSRKLFNMEVWSGSLSELCSDSAPDDCGSIHCLGGWIEKLAEMPYNSLRHICPYPTGLDALFPTGLNELFYPSGNYKDYNNITAEQAYLALCNYLSRGEPYWHEVLQKRR